MNRRELLRRGPVAVIGGLGILAGVKAEPEQRNVIINVSVPMDENHIVRVVRDNYRRGGKIRDLLQQEVK